jgi:hypothetical protein
MIFNKITCNQTQQLFDNGLTSSFAVFLALCCLFLPYIKV